MDCLHVDVARCCARAFTVGGAAVDEGRAQASLGQFVCCGGAKDPGTDDGGINGLNSNH
jgi:hypothetical protein